MTSYGYGVGQGGEFWIDDFSISNLPSTDPNPDPVPERSSSCPIDSIEEWWSEEDVLFGTQECMSDSWALFHSGDTIYWCADQFKSQKCLMSTPATRAQPQASLIDRHLIPTTFTKTTVLSTVSTSDQFVFSVSEKGLTMHNLNAYSTRSYIIDDSFNILILYSRTLEDCKLECALNPECVGFSRQTPNPAIGNCYLKRYYQDPAYTSTLWGWMTYEKGTESVFAYSGYAQTSNVKIADQAFSHIAVTTARFGGSMCGNSYCQDTPAVAFQRTGFEKQFIVTLIQQIYTKMVVVELSEDSTGTYMKAIGAGYVVSTECSTEAEANQHWNNRNAVSVAPCSSCGGYGLHSIEFEKRELRPLSQHLSVCEGCK
jgi:hypothetical protein